MEYIEIKKDLFSVDEDYYFVHCISSDIAMGKGIAVKFRDMGVKKFIKDTYAVNWEGTGFCIGARAGGRTVFNLVTKQYYYDKPTYQTMRQALEDLYYKLERLEFVFGNHVKLAMPLIGCGLDKLEWNKVSEIIKDVFKDADVEILVCRL